MTKGYNLNAKSIYYLKYADNLRDWFERFRTFLTMAEKDGVHTLAIPAFGSGKQRSQFLFQ